MTVYVPINKCEECLYYEFGYDLDNGTCADVCCYFDDNHIITDCTKIQEWCPYGENGKVELTKEEFGLPFYVKVSTVGDLKKVLNSYPHSMRLSKINKDDSINVSTRFYYNNGLITFGYEGC